MTTQEFMSLLEQHADEGLVFSTDRATVPAGYHVTEIKSATIQAMDCGGMATEWNETILQLLPPARATDEAPMRVATFLGIHRRVAGSIPVRGDATVRVEYGSAGDDAVSYVVTDIQSTSRGAEVRLAAPAVACKGADRSVGNVPTADSLASGSGRPEATACCPSAGAGATARVAGDSARGACCG